MENNEANNKKAKDLDSVFTSSIDFHRNPLFKRLEGKRIPLSFNLELTARCNNNCPHCYINLPAGDINAKSAEMSLEFINKIVDEAVSMGALWCNLTGGEPLLREDFEDIYLCLRNKGLLISLLTNGTLINERIVKLFARYPPRNIEITVYGVTQSVYEKVSRKSGSFKAFKKGLGLLLDNGIKVRLKAAAIKSNYLEMPAIASFCREKTWDYFRFDPFLHLRYDGNPIRNDEIKGERLSAEEIIELERNDSERLKAVKKECGNIRLKESVSRENALVFRCSAGYNSFTVGFDGVFRICDTIFHPDCLYDLKAGSLREAWMDFTPKALSINLEGGKTLHKCWNCKLLDLCDWCPAKAYLETGSLDREMTLSCEIAHRRAQRFG